MPFISVYQAVIIEAFLWGLGTAIGELPPYFVSRAASLAGKKQEEIEELAQETQKSTNELPLIERAKVWLYKNLKNHAFIVVTLFASIPNPLFDLAGLICGQFLVPFGVFFGATFLGKAVFKVSI